MKTTILKGIFICAFMSLFNSCIYRERGHANTPAAYPGTQMQVDEDTVSYPGNFDKRG